MPCTGAKRLVQGYTPPVPFHYVYVLRSSRDHHFYTDSTNDLRRRLSEHRQGKNASTARRLPIELLYFEGHRSKGDAERGEAYFKTTKGRVMNSNSKCNTEGISDHPENVGRK
jgi:predicted GIY-YIG superfamily endonuclease